MTADARCRRGAASVTAVAGEDEGLCGGEGENFAFRGCAGGFMYLLGCLLPHHLFQFMPPRQQSWGVRKCTAGEKRHIPQRLWRLGAEADVVVYQTCPAVRFFRPLFQDVDSLEEGE